MFGNELCNARTLECFTADTSLILIYDHRWLCWASNIFFNVSRDWSTSARKCSPRLFLANPVHQRLSVQWAQVQCDRSHKPSIDLPSILRLMRAVSPLCSLSCITAVTVIRPTTIFSSNSSYGNSVSLIPIYAQQDETLHSLFISGNCSTCFGWYLHPLSGAHTTVSRASGTCQTVTATCRYRGRVRTAFQLLMMGGNTTRNM